MQAVTINRDVQGGLPCFAGTRVPVTILFDHLKKGYTVAEFVADFPTVRAEQAEAVLDQATADVQLRAVRVGAE